MEEQFGNIIFSDRSSIIEEFHGRLIDEFFRRGWLKTPCILHVTISVDLQNAGFCHNRTRINKNTQITPDYTHPLQHEWGSVVKQRLTCEIGSSISSPPTG